MIITIHQPEHLPWLGFFDKIRQVDLFVVLDQVPFRKHYFQNRNRIRGKDGIRMLTVPVLQTGRMGQSIYDVEIDNRCAPNWQEKHWRSMEQCYAKVPFFANYAPLFWSHYQQKWEFLVDFNLALLTAMFKALAIQVPMIRASTLDLTQTKGELLLEICRQLGATTYLAGISAPDYLPFNAFERLGIQVKIQHFYHPIYPQRFQPFTPCLSALDLIFNHGPDAMAILCDPTTPRLDYLFE